MEEFKVLCACQDHTPSPDKYRVVVAVTAFFVLCIEVSVFEFYAIFYADIIEYFGTSVGFMGWVISITGSLSCLSGVYTGPLVDQHGCRLVGFLGGLLGCVGLAINMMISSNVRGKTLAACGCVTLSSLQRYFDENDPRRPMVMGFVYLGTSVSGFIFPPLARHLIDVYAWRGALLILAGVYLNACALAMLYRPRTHARCRACARRIALQRPAAAATQTTFCERLMDFSLLRSKRFLAMSVGSFLLSFGEAAFYHHSVNALVFSGYSKHTGAMFRVIVAVVNVVGRVLISIFTGVKKVNLVGLYALTVCTGGMATVAMGFTPHQLWLFVVAGGCAGFSMGGYYYLKDTVMLDLFGATRLARSMGLRLIFSGTGFLVAAPTGGYIYDVTKSYATPFSIMGGLQLLGGLLTFTILFPKKQRRFKDNVLT